MRPSSNVPMLPSRPRRGVALASVLALALILGVATPLQADVIHLKSGQAIKGKAIREESTSEYLVVRDFVSGARRVFNWNVVDDADEHALKVDWNWVRGDNGLIDGVVLTVALDGDATEEVSGVLVSKSGDEYVLRAGAQPQPARIPKNRVLDEREEKLDPRDVYPVDELYRMYIKEQGEPSNGREHFAAGRQAEWISALDEAEMHFAKAAEDPEFDQADEAKARLEGVLELKRNAAAFDAIKQLNRWTALGLYKKARAGIAEFEAAHNREELHSAVVTRFDRAKSRFEEARDKKLRGVAARNFPRICMKFCMAQVREKDVTLRDCTAWTKKDLPTLAFGKLAETLSRYDDVTPDQALQVWESRLKGRAWRKVSYGSGTFIIEPAKVKAPKRRAGGANRGRNGGGGGPTVQIPKPPTQDQWWAKAKAKERATWIMAFFVERSGFFEVAEEPQMRPCSLCNGDGLQTQLMTNGATLAYICTRCAGSRYDKTVRYR